ncbi:MAG: GNAT family N-acetyltransferase [Actinomycetia bacterium]|nr:GNAT family N-acetyltransferase [Actinomycetes bacterium]
MDEAAERGADAIVEGTLRWSFLAPDDLEELAALREAIDYFEDPVDHRDQDAIVSDYQRDIALDGYLATVGRDRGGSIVAYAWIHPSVSPGLNGHLWLDMGVHPAARHRAIGRRLITWCITRAEEWQARRDPDAPPLWLGYLVDEKFGGLRAALAEQGFTPQRWLFDAHRAFDDEPLPLAPDVAGVRLERYRADLSEPVRLAHNSVFGVLPGAQPYTRPEWEWALGETHLHPEWSWVAREEGGLVVGYALNTVYPDDDGNTASEGWTALFGVRRPWRRQGIGTALIGASMGSFHAAGLDGAGLGIDTENPRAAERLMEHFGFAADDRVVLYARGATS